VESCEQREARRFRFGFRRRFGASIDPRSPDLRGVIPEAGKLGFR
jgi:hypothetical protein